jgi:hypothetical protein
MKAMVICPSDLSMKCPDGIFMAKLNGLEAQIPAAKEISADLLPRQKYLRRQFAGERA